MNDFYYKWKIKIFTRSQYQNSIDNEFCGYLKASDGIFFFFFLINFLFSFFLAARREPNARLVSEMATTSRRDFLRSIEKKKQAASSAYLDLW